MRHIVTAQSILRGTRKFSFALGTLLALCLMAFGALGNVASAHPLPSKHHNVIVLSHVQLNIVSCNQYAKSKAFYKAGNSTKQIQCIFVQKNVSKNQQHVGPTDLMTTDLSRGIKGRHSTVIVLSHVQLNIVSCNQYANSKAVYKAGNRTKQIQCIFIQKNVSKNHK